MLRIKAKSNIKTSLTNLNVSELYLSPDLSYISGVTDCRSNMSNGDYISLKTPYINSNVKRKINVEKVKRQGYVLAYEKCPIRTAYSIGDNGVKSVKYIKYNGNYYYIFTNGNLSGVIVDGVFYNTNEDQIILIPTKHWIENGNTFIGGVKYYLNMDLIENSMYTEGYNPPVIKKYDDDSTLIAFNDNYVNVYDYGYDKWHDVLKFVINDTDNNIINIQSGITVTLDPFIVYKDDIYSFMDIASGSEGIYGVLISGKTYTADDISSLDDFNYSEDKTINIDGTVLDIQHNIKTDVNGMRIVLYSDGDVNLQATDTIIAKSNDISHTEQVYTASTGELYVYYDNKYYLVNPDICDTVTIDDDDYEITYINANKTLGYIVINNKKIEITIQDNNGSKIWTIKNNIYIPKKNSDGSVVTNFGKLSSFTVNKISGITLSDGTKCPVYSSETDDESYAYCVLNAPKIYRLRLESTMGSNGLICLPYINDADSTIDYDKIKSICNDIKNNIGNFTFYYEEGIFGNENIDESTGILYALNANYPVSTKDVNTTLDKIKIYKVNNYLSVPLSLDMSTDTSLNKDDLIQNDYVNDRIQENINPIVDMEKDVYYPAYKQGNKFIPITEIEFNLHFRTRDLDSWKVIEDDTENYGGNLRSTTSDKSNWFITDYYPYKNVIDNNDGKPATLSMLREMQRSSDLMGLLGFTYNDIKYRKKKISKSFIRLSFYSTPNPQNQVLLATSTIFLDVNKLFKKFMFNNMNAIKNNKEISLIESAFTTSNNEITADELSEQIDSSPLKFTINNYTRFDSKIIVDDKYNTTTSSEGFYLYLFREYSTELRENTIYLKVDFCHANNGLVIPFIIPNIDGNPVYLENLNDVKKMKEGIAMTDVYDNMYIPLKVKYSLNDKKFFYYLPDEYVENHALGVSDNTIMMFNLFELKIKNQSY